MTDEPTAEEIEKVAWAICQTIADDVTSYWAGMTIEQFVEENWRFYTAEARAAILAAEPYIRAREREEIQRQVNARLNDMICDMRPDFDDSITGLNEAWDAVNDVIRAREEGEG